MELTKAVFRVDSSYEIGTGHVKRCLSLAAELSSNQVECIFVLRDLFGNLKEEILSCGYQLNIIDYKKKLIDKDEFDEILDAETTIEILKGIKPNLLIIDHYEIDNVWERKVKPYVDDIIVIDDYLSRSHECNYFFNQNYFLNKTLEISNIRSDKGVFIGTRFSLLGAEYLEKRQEILKLNKNAFCQKLNNCLVYFGGSDKYNLLLKIINIVKKENFPNLHLHIVLGINYDDADRIKNKVRPHENITFHDHSKSLANLLSKCDFAIGSPGTTTWERMCLGVPSILISIANNQEENLKNLEKSGFIVSAGRFQNLTDENIKKSIKLLINKGFQNKIRQKCLTLVDGYGTKRVAQLILPNIEKNYSLRTAEDHDIYTIYFLANEESVRKHSLKTDRIPWEVHRKWFTEKINSKNSKIYIFEINLLPIGVIRFDYSDRFSAAVISFAIDPIFRGRKYGQRMLSMGIENCGYRKFIAYVKVENKSSKRIFEELCFIQTEYNEVGNFFIYEFS